MFFLDAFFFFFYYYFFISNVKLYRKRNSLLITQVVYIGSFHKPKTQKMQKHPQLNPPKKAHNPKHHKTTKPKTRKR
jgi:hypothetical protein